MILTEIGDFSRFNSPDKILAYAGLSPSTYQSGQLDSNYSHMENVVPATCGMPCLTRQNLSAYEMTPLLPILPGNVQKESTIT